MYPSRFHDHREEQIVHLAAKLIQEEVEDSPSHHLGVLTPSYELKIPNDSTASLTTAGIVGETYVQIDAARASGPPLEAEAVLKTIPTTQLL